MLCDQDVFTRLLRARPLLLASIMYLSGCILGNTANVPCAFLTAGIVFLLLTAIALRKKQVRIAAAILIIAFIPLGALRFELSWSSLDPFPEERDVVLSGRICKEPYWNENTERTICVLEDICIDGKSRTGRLRLYLRGDDIQSLQNVHLAQRVQASAHIWQGDTASNPGEFDFDRFLRLNSLRGYATAKIEETEFTLPVYHPSDWPERICMKIAARIDRLFPENAAFAKAFLIGDRSGLSDEDRKNFSISGAAHLLAISGMHISVLASAVSLLLGRMLSKKRAFILTMILMMVYGSIIGFSAALMRAILMFFIFNLAPIAGRYSDAPTRLGTAMLLYLFVRPLAILEAGFVLSYGAAAGIILLDHPLKELLHTGEYLRKRTDVGMLSTFTHRLPRWIIQATVTTLAAQIAILPAVVHFFGTHPVWSVFANLVSVPLAMIAYILAFAGVITGLTPITWISDLLFGLLSDYISLFSKLPFAAFGIARFPAWLVLLCAASCFCASDLSKLPVKLRRWLPLAVIPAVLIANILSMSTTQGCSIVFLDAGEADCAVIRCEGGVHLIDTGDTYSPAADYISTMNYQLDSVFLSHPHTDHAGGLADILEICTPKCIYISENWNQFEMDDCVADALITAEDQGSRIIAVSAGDTISLSGETLLEVLSPAAGIPANSANDDSLVLRLQHGECSALFTGDAPAEIVHGLTEDIDLMKLAHHGSSDALNANLLAELSPSAVIIPVGENNYGHPAKDTMKLLNAAGVQIFRTDLHGAVTCHLNENGSVFVRPYQTSEDVNGLE